MQKKKAMNPTFDEVFVKFLAFKKPKIKPGSFDSLIKLQDKIALFQNQRTGALDS